jgi:hypothetical protein
MPSRFSRSITLLCIALLLSLGQPATAQNNQPQQQLSGDLAALVRHKFDLIQVETAGPGEEWAGRYQASHGPTITTDLAWSPKSGFIVWWENCSRPGSTRVNHGGAVFTDGSLKITPEVPENVPGSFRIATEFIPVKWGAQHFLIPQDQLIKFIYAAKSGSVSEVESFLLKKDDYTKQRRGLPSVAPQYARYLRMKPIVASISTVGPEPERWYPKVILNAGKSEGVIQEMKFYYRRGGRFIVFEVTSVDEHTSAAAVVLANTSNDSEQELKLKAGWKVSSRAPKGNERFMP